MQDFDHLMLGRNPAQFEVNDNAALRQAALALARQARRSLDIYSPNLERMVYGQTAFCEAVKQLIMYNRRARIRVLLRDSRRAREEGHRLIHLGRRYVSKIRFRIPAEDSAMDNDAFLIADGIGLLYRHDVRKAAGHVCFQAPQQCRRLGQRFEREWLQAEPDPYLRWLFL